MKYRTLVCSVAAVLLALQAHSQNSSPGNAGNATGGASSSGGSTSGSSSSAGTAPSTGSLPPGLERRDSLPPGLENRDELPPGLARRTNDLSPTSDPRSSSMGSSGTNSASGGGLGQDLSATGTNAQSGANRVGSVTNQSGSGLTPTGSTNSLYRDQSQSGTSGGNGASSTSSTATQDRTYTQQDRTLLTTIRQKVSTEISTTTGSTTAGFAGGAIPVNFVVRSGVVELVGVVPTIEEKKRIETIVERVPGVTRVVNQLQVSSQASSTTTTGSSGAQGGAFGMETESSMTGTNASGLSTTNRLFPTSQGTNSGSRIYSTTNQAAGSGNDGSLTPTSSGTNGSRSYNLPPGLEKRDSLPPGLQNRDQLPPGLERRNDGAGSNP